MENLTKNGTFSAEASETKQPASALLWAYYFAAQHFDYKQETDRALHYIDAAIEHTPTLIELFIVKGRIYKVSRTAYKIILDFRHDLPRWQHGALITLEKSETRSYQ